MVAYLLIQTLLLAGLFYLLWRSFGRKLFDSMTHDPERETAIELERVREQLASLPTLEEASAGAGSPGPVELLRADYQHEERRLMARLERLRNEKNIP